MEKFNYQTAHYSVSGMGSLSLDKALKLWKTKFPTIVHFRRAVIKTESLKEFGEFVEEMWEDIIPITVAEAFEEKNVEMRRVYFDCIGVEELFKSVSPKLLDRQVVKKKRTRWDAQNDPYEHVFEDVYELYSIDPAKLYATADMPDWQRGRRTEQYIAVRCWCTTTNREYWIYVPEDNALKDGIRRWSDEKDKSYDAVKAIAWTIQLDITLPERIYRQGDIIIAKESSASKKTSMYHLNKDQYLQLMYSET